MSEQHPNFGGADLTPDQQGVCRQILDFVGELNNAGISEDAYYIAKSNALVALATLVSGQTKSGETLREGEKVHDKLLGTKLGSFDAGSIV